MEITSLSAASYSMPLFLEHERLVDLLKQHGVIIPTATPAAVDRVNNLNLSAKRLSAIAQSISHYTNELSEMAAAAVDFSNNKDFTVQYLARQGFRCDGDFLSTLQNDDLVEAYDLDHIQFYRNMPFMKVCGYTLAEILSCDWSMLFERSQVITQGMFDAIQTVIEKKHTVMIEQGAHYMKERFSLSRRLYTVKFRAIGSLFDENKNLAGYIGACAAEVLDEQPARHELRFI